MHAAVEEAMKILHPTRPSSKEGTSVGAGRPTILTPAEEKEIEISCQVLQELTECSTKADFKQIFAYICTLAKAAPPEKHTTTIHMLHL